MHRPDPASRAPTFMRWQGTNHPSIPVNGGAPTLAQEAPVDDTPDPALIAPPWVAMLQALADQAETTHLEEES